MTKHLSIIAAVFLSINALAQTGTIKGKVTTSDGKPAEFVSVAVKGTHKGTVTNASGDYTINNVPVGEQIVFTSYVGTVSVEKPVSVTVNEITVVNISLEVSATQLEEITIETQKEKGYVELLSSQGLRIKTSLIETPQNIQIVNQEVIRDQQSFQILETIRNVSGVTATSSFTPGINDFFSFRGFQNNHFYRNGLFISAIESSFGPDNQFVERIEFVKGPGGFLIGQGAPGGAMNIVTKGATKRRVRDISLTGGSFQTFRAGLDLGGEVKEGSGVTYRLNVLGQNANSFLDNVYTNRYGVAPSIGYQLDEKTYVQLDYTYQKVDFVNPGHPAMVVGGKFFQTPRSFNASPLKPDPTDINDHLIAASMQHKFTDKWILNASLAAKYYTYVGSRYEVGWPNRNVASLDDTVQVIRNYRDSESRLVTSQMYLNGDFNNGFVRHRITTGVELGSDVASTVNKRWRDSADVYYDKLSDFSMLEHPTINQAVPTNPDFVYGQNWAAGFLYDHINFTDKLSINVGARYSFYNTYATYNDDPNRKEESVNLAPRLGINYLIKPNHAVYGLYDQGFEATPGIDKDGNRYKPQRANNLEAGVKSYWINNRLSTTLTYFNITRTNAITFDPQDPSSPFGIQRGQVNSSGIELDVVGKLLPGLSVISNYALINPKITKDSDENMVGKRFDGYSKHIINTWFKYDFTKGFLTGFSLAAGSRSELERYAYPGVLDDYVLATSEVVPSYTSLNAGLYYRREKIIFSLYLDNLTDERFYVNPTFGNDEAAGRNFRFSVNYQF